MTNHLLKRGSRYYIRRKIPLDLQPQYDGRKEIVKALGTSDPVDARRLVREESVRLDREFDARRAARCEPEQQQVPELVADPDTGETLWTGKWLTYTPPVAGQVSSAFELPENEGFIVSDDESAASRRAYMRKVKEARRFHATAIALRGFDLTPPVPVPVTPEAVHPAPESRPASSTTTKPSASLSEGHLAALVEKWAREREPDIRTHSAANLVVQRFYTYVGRIPVARITRQHVIAFKDKLLESGQTAVNTDKQLTVLRALLSFAVLNAQATLNPAQGVKVGERKNARAARLPFDLPALQAIFSSPVYTAGARPEGGAREAAYWLPLLGLFTGARIEELCQLRPEDIYEEAYSTAEGESRTSWVLRITNEGAGQGVKNATSIRRVPLHSELLARGFLDYVSDHRGKARIFPALKPDNKGAESGTGPNGSASIFGVSAR